MSIGCVAIAGGPQDVVSSSGALWEHQTAETARGRKWCIRYRVTGLRNSVLAISNADWGILSVAVRSSFRSVSTSGTVEIEARLHHLPAGSPDLVSRIEFVILRTDRSPPAASHPVLRRRSCIRFHAGERMHEEDFHLSDRVRSQAHWHGRPAREARQDKIQHSHGRDGHATKTRLARDCVRVMRSLAISVWQGSGQAISRDTGGS